MTGLTTKTLRDGNGSTFTGQFFEDADGDLWPVHIIANASGQVLDLSALIGEVQASPTANTVLDRLKTIATSLSGISGYVDGMEALATTLNGYVDGLETLIGATNTALTTIDGRVDGLEGLITSLNGYADGLEALIGTTNSSLATLAGYQDGVEAAIASTNTKLDTLQRVTYTDASITSATGSSQTLLASNASRNALIIVNDAATNWTINPIGGTAAAGGTGCFTLAPGDAWTPRPAPTNAITAIGDAASKLTVLHG